MPNRRRKTRGNLPVYQSSVPDIKLVEHVSGLVDPFSDQSTGSKIHDANGADTFTVKSIARHLVPTGASGNGYAEFYPAVKDNASITQSNTDIPASGVMPASPNNTLSDIPEYTNFNSSTARYRIVSWGIRITCPQNALDASGNILIREIQNVQTAATSETTKYTARYLTLPITHDMDYTVVPDHQGEEYHRFSTASVTYATTYADNAMEPGFKAVSISIMGAKASITNALQVEVVYNLEALPFIGSLAVRMATPAAPHNHPVLAAVHNVRAKLPMAIKSSSLWNKVKGFAQKALVSGAQHFLGNGGGEVVKFITDKIGLHAKTKRLTQPRPRMLLKN